jgi:putative transposase
MKNFHQKSDSRIKLVEIHAWCLMNNHYHLLLSPANDDPNNISLFMKKLNMGYAKYFNEKYKRSGYLWQGKYKKIGIKHDAHFMHIPHYIHLNPLDYTLPQWRTGTVKNSQEALDYLLQYRWSSYLDYMGTRNFPSLINTKIVKELCKDTQHIRSIIGSELLAKESMLIE